MNHPTNPLSASLTILSPQHQSNSINAPSGVLYNWGEKFSSKATFNPIVPNVKSICNGYSHTLALGEDNQVYSWGDNRSLQLGVPINANFSPAPLLVGKNQFHSLKVKAIACGGCFSAVILENGLLYTWGILTEGSKYTDIPTRVDLLRGVTSVSVGINHVAVVAETTTGEKRAVFTWGSNKKGQLGVSGDSITSAPRRVTLGAKALSVSCGEEFTAAIVEGNEVFIWGSNKSKQICNNSDEIISIPVKPFLGRDIIELASSRTFVAGRSSHGEICVWGNNEYVVRPGDSDKWISFPSRVKQMSVGLNHILVLCDRGEVYSWGFGDDGQLGHEDKKPLTQFKQIESLKGRNIVSVHAWGRCSGAIVEPGNFRVEISETMRRAENRNSPAPLFIRKLTNYLRGDNSKAEGIFRLNGSVARLEELERRLDSGERFSITKYEPYDAADIIKRYFKTLPEPLFTNVLCAKYEKEILKTSDQSARNQMLLEWISKLPLESRTLLIYILSFLNEIAYAQTKYQKNNAMAEKNLALVFAPNLLTRGEIGNDDIIEDLVKMLPDIMKIYPEMESLIIIDQATECLRGSRTSYIIDHWNRIMKERVETAKPAFFSQPVLHSIINSIVDGILNMRSSRSNSFSSTGNLTPTLHSTSPNHSPENSPAPRISTQSISLSSLLNVTTLGSVSPIHNGGGSSLNLAGNNTNLMNAFGGSLGTMNGHFLITKQQANTSANSSLSNSTATLTSSNSQLNLVEQSRHYETVLSLVLSPVIPIKSIIKVLPSIFEIDNVNNLFVKLLLLNQFENSVSIDLLENMTSLSQLLKEFNNGFNKDKLLTINQSMESIVKDMIYLNNCIEYWEKAKVNINHYGNQILSYFKWWGEFLDKTNKDIEEKVLRFKKDFDKLENEKSKIEKQQNKLLEKQHSISNTNSSSNSNSSSTSTTPSAQSPLLQSSIFEKILLLDSNQIESTIKSEYEVWCLNNQIDVIDKKLEYTNQQIQRFQHEKSNAQFIQDQFKPHLLLIEDFITYSVNQSLNSYLEKLSTSIKSQSSNQFSLLFSQYIDTLFLKLKEISNDSQIKDQLAQSLAYQSNLFNSQSIPKKYILSLELETKLNSLKKNV